MAEGIKPGNITAFSAALFSETTRLMSMKNLLTGAAPTSMKTKEKQTEKGAPIVRVTDLSKGAGDEVKMDVFHRLSGTPFLGDERIEGRGENLEKTRFGAKINQVRKPVTAGGNMAQKRTQHNLKSVAKALLGEYYKDQADEKMIYHLAGARGDLKTATTIYPLASDPRFDDYMINDILPPTYDRQFYAGDATSIENLDSADLFTMDVVKDIRMHLDESDYPLQPVQYKDDTMSGESPMHVMFVTPKQWRDLEDNMSAKDWNQIMASALQRSKGFDHPLFKGDCVMIDNILIRKYHRPVRFNTGSTVSVCNNDKAATVAQKTVATNVERAVLLGAQALGDFYGSTESGVPFKYWEGKTDHDNASEQSIAWMEGLAKIRFECTDGYVRDHGVICVDSAVKAR
jgi:N4-gp56 family major capsid protein